MEESPFKHSVITLMEGFFYLVEMGYFFHCPSKNWKANPLTDKGRLKYSPAKQILNCNSLELYEGLKKIPVAMDKLRLRNEYYYAYLDKDKSNGLIDSWVKITPRVNQTCSLRKNILPQELDLENYKIKIF